jgi:hypothetical protein
VSKGGVRKSLTGTLVVVEIQTTPAEALSQPLDEEESSLDGERFSSSLIFHVVKRRGREEKS